MIRGPGQHRASHREELHEVGGRRAEALANLKVPLGCFRFRVFGCELYSFGEGVGFTWGLYRIKDDFACTGCMQA